jgi:hypothetical protein
MPADDVMELLKNGKGGEAYLNGVPIYMLAVRRSQPVFVPFVSRRPNIRCYFPIVIV